MKKKFREFVSNLGPTHNVALVANGGFFPKCLVVSLFFLLTLPLLPFSAKGQMQTSVPAGEIQEQMTTSSISSSRYMAPWDLKRWGSALFPHITITSTGVKVEAYDPYRISCHGRVQLVVSSCETGAIVYQTLMEADSSKKDLLLLWQIVLSTSSAMKMATSLISMRLITESFPCSLVLRLRFPLIRN